MTNQNTNKTHCKNGHLLSQDNLVKWDWENKQKRKCKTCRNNSARIAQQTNEAKQYKLDWQRTHKENVKQYNKKWNDVNRKEYSREWDKKNTDKRKEINNRHNKTISRIEYRRSWQRANPRSNTGYPDEVRIPMENVRERDNNTCKWYGCSKTYPEVSIHVHHIFPKNEYPDLVQEEKYMICYCQYHHAFWHKARNDRCAGIISGWHKKEIVSKPYGNT